MKHDPAVAATGRGISWLLCLSALTFSVGCGKNERIPQDKPRVDEHADGTRTVSFKNWKGRPEDYRLVKDYDKVINVSMGNPDVTDETLAHLTGLTTLKDLDLDTTQVTPNGLRQLTPLEHLETLRLNNAPNIDDGLWDVITALKALNTVEVLGTKVSKTAAEKWRAVDPKKRRVRI